MSNTSMCLGQRVTFLRIGSHAENLIQEATKAYSLGTLATVELIGFSIRRTKTMMESINVVINDDDPEVTETVTDDDEAPVTTNDRANVKPSVT